MNIFHSQQSTDVYQEKLAAVRHELKIVLQETVLPFDWFTDELLQAQEENFPLLLLLASDISQTHPERQIRAAAIIEILLMGMRVHRKIGEPFPLSQNEIIQKNQWIILTGDYLYAKALALAVQESVLLVRGVSEMIQSLVIAGVMSHPQVPQGDSRDVREFEKIYAHAANLASICCRLGAQIGSASPAVIRSLSEYGYALGMATQARQQMLTETRSLSASLGQAHRPTRIVTYFTALVKQYIHKAKQSLSELPSCPARDQLASLAERLLAIAE
jgi:geranylgeranyl pyrophosphate synthase